MRTNKFWIIIFLFLFTECVNDSSKPKSDLEEIDISNSFNDNKKAFLSEIATDIRYIKLQTDTSCFINRIREPSKNIQFANNRVFISDGKILYVFDYYGKFINKIDKTGKGPGEYKSIENFTILSKDSLIVIFSASQQAAFFYDFETKFIKKFKVDFWPTALTSSINDDIIFGNPKGRRTLSDYYCLSILDKDGTLKKHVINNSWEKKIEKKDEISLNDMSQFYIVFDTLSYWEFQYDTIYRIADSYIAAPRYYINLGADKLPFSLLLKSEVEDNPEAWDPYIKLWSYVETERYFFFRIGYKTKLKHIVYDKVNKESFSLQYRKEKPKLKYINDLDGGYDFWPEGNAFKNTVYTLFYGYELKAFLSKDRNKESISSKDGKIELQNIINQSEIKDNPIIMLVSLR